MRHRREVRRIGFNEDAVGGRGACDLLDIRRGLEGQDTRKGDVAAKLEALSGEGRGSGEAVENEGESPLPCSLLFENFGRVVVRGPRVDDEGEGGPARGIDVAAEARGLGGVVALVVIVEPSLADSNAARMLAQPH